MKPLYEDQIHVGPFLDLTDYIWSDDVSRSVKGGVWDYFKGISEKHSKPLIGYTNIPPSGIIFVGMCHIIEDIFRGLPPGGSYIIIHRPSDRSFTEEIYKVKPPSVKYIYTVDCRVNREDVFAIPFGNGSIYGHDGTVIEVAKEDISPAVTKIFCRMNINPATIHRNEAIRKLKNKPFVKMIEEQISREEFCRQIKAHKFTMGLAGCGMDAARQWAAIQLGSIPIVTDCIEMRHFEDLPLVYCPENMDDITEEWLDGQDVSSKSTERMRMSYWENHINRMKNML